MTPSRIGLLVSLALHAVLALAVSWWWFAPKPAPAQGQVVPLSLAMFEAPPVSTQPVAQPAPLPAKKLAAVDSPPSLPKPPASPEPVKPPPMPQQDPPAPKAESKPAPKPDKPRSEPRQRPSPPKSRPVHTEHKSAQIHHSKPKPQSKPRPQPKPKPEPVSKPQPETSAHKPVRARPEAAATVPRPSTGPESRHMSSAEARPPAGASTAAPKVDLTQLQLQYQSALSAAINRQKFYPRMARRLRQEGMVTVAFTVLADGSIQDMHVVGPSGMPLLDRGAVEAIRRVGRFRPIPPALGVRRMQLRIVLSYNLR